MLDFQLDASKDDFSKVRTLTTVNNTYYLEREDPYGFIKIKSKVGKLPKKLEGQFTSFPEAEKVLARYLNEVAKK
jgi:hypothetical protein